MKYRVDRSMYRGVPVGMNSIRYIGNSFKKAKQVYNALAPGLDSWDNPNNKYGVVLSSRSGSFDDDMILEFKTNG